MPSDIQVMHAPVREMEALQRVSLQLASSLDLRVLMDTIIESVAGLVRPDVVHLFLHDQETDAFSLGAAWRDGGERTPVVRTVRAEGITALAVNQRAPVIINDAAQHPLYGQSPSPEVRAWGVQAIAAFPLVRPSGVMGVFTVSYIKPYQITPAVVRITSLIADQAAVALENARLYAVAQSRSEEAERVKNFNEKLLNSIEAGILLESRDDRIEYVNPRLCEMLHYGPEEMIGRPAAMLLTPDMERHVDQQAARRAHGEKGRYEAALLRRDGVELPVLVHATPMFSGGVFSGTLTAFIDITQRKYAEQTLLALNNAASHVRQASDPQQVFATISSELCKVGLSLAVYRYDASADALLLDHFAFAPRLRRSRLAGIITRSVLDGVAVRYADAMLSIMRNKRAVYVPGSKHTVLAGLAESLAPPHVLNEELSRLCTVLAPLMRQDELFGLLAVMGDQLTPDSVPAVQAFANQASAALDNAFLLEAERRHRRQAETLSHAARALNVATDPRDALPQVLEQLHAALSYDNSWLYLMEQDVLVLRAAEGPVAADAIGSRVRPGAYATVDRLIEGVKPLVISDTSVDPIWRPTPDCDYIASWIGAPLVSGGQLIGVLIADSAVPHRFGPDDLQTMAAFADLTAVAIERAQLYRDTLIAYEELRDLDRVKDDLVANVSHELRTPLTFIKGYVEYLLEGYAGDVLPEQREALEIILDRSDAVIQLVNDIVSLKQAEMVGIEPVRVDLHTVASACVQGSLAAAEKAGIRIELVAEPDFPPVCGDALRLGQVFDNLIGNAIKFSARGDRIVVSLAGGDAEVLVSVSDTGIGISADRLDRIWERFYQVDGAWTRRHSGTGLGLTITKRIVEAHNGKIWVESQPDEGSTFRFTVPVWCD